MPLFVIHALDRSDALPDRLEHYAAHRAFVESDHLHGVRVVMSGPLQSGDGERMIGSLFMIEAESQDVVEAFAHADPFLVRGVWERVSVSRFHRRVG